MGIEFNVLRAVARGLKSKNLVFNKEFVRDGKKIYQQIFHNAKTNDLVLKQIVDEGKIYHVNSYGFSGKLKVLPWNKTERIPVWDYVKKEALEEGSIPALLVQDIPPKKIVTRVGMNERNHHMMFVAHNGKLTEYDNFFNQYFVKGSSENKTMADYLRGGADCVYIS